MNSAEMPYGLAGRPMPAGNDPDRLLPRQVGAFSRPAIKPPGPGMPIYAEYRQGAATVFMELGIGDNAEESRAALDTARDEVGGTGPGSLFAEGPDGACLRTVDAGGGVPGLDPRPVLLLGPRSGRGKGPGRVRRGVPLLTRARAGPAGRVVRRHPLGVAEFGPRAGPGRNPERDPGRDHHSRELGRW